MSAALKVLQGVFPQLSPEAIRRLYDSARVVNYPAQHVLCQEGTDGSDFFVLVEGEVEVLKNAEQGPHRLDTLHRGQFFGEMSLLLNQPRTADVVAITPVTVIQIDRPAFNHHIKTNMTLVTAMNSLIIQRLLNQEQDLLEQLPKQSQSTGTPQVFMSYSRIDQEFVRRLVADLKARDIPVWLDQTEIGVGMIWSAEIQKALDACRVIVVMLSPNGAESRHAADEWHYFLDESKPVVPVLYQDCRIPYQLRRIQHIDFAHKSYDAALEELVATLQKYTPNTQSNTEK
ncbi:MAG: TIR domain-containing protein [Anaerolineae bacterium]|nr:TIR domain-containing protein [Anaerolineae bacterium]